MELLVIAVIAFFIGTIVYTSINAGHEHEKLSEQK